VLVASTTQLSKNTISNQAATAHIPQLKKPQKTKPSKRLAQEVLMASFFVTLNLFSKVSKALTTLRKVLPLCRLPCSNRICFVFEALIQDIATFVV
jgi:hypothetical protein